MTKTATTLSAADIARIKVIPRGKRSLIQAKNNGPLKLDTIHGQLGAATYQKRASSLVPHDPTRQSVDNQINALKLAIRRNLKAIASLTANGKVEKATFTAGIVATQRNRLVALAEQYGAASLADPGLPPDPPQPGKSRSKSKRRTYKRWSDK